MTDVAGRTCPTAYRYGPGALAKAPELASDTLYVIGGLYGNLSALEAIEAMASMENGPVQLCFNGDFNWFNVDDEGFQAVNAAVFQYDAILGNVEAELLETDSLSGCGCAYPENVDDGVVERSNRIHARLKATARHHPAIIKRLSELPMFRRFLVGDTAIGVVHGDADSLAGWQFDVAALDDISKDVWRAKSFALANVDVFACTHTCLPALRQYAFEGEAKVVVNNGAAGMPNFLNTRYGLVTRISVTPSPHQQLYGVRRNEIFIDAIPVAYDQARWLKEFLENWPAGSPAHLSYLNRIVAGPNYALRQAAPRDTADELCSQ